MIADIEAQAAGRRQESGQEVMGMAAVQGQDPLGRPRHPKKKSPRPLVHAATKAARQSYLMVRKAFVTVYCEASKALRQGDRNVAFPCWCFPPALSFTRSGRIFVPFWDGYEERFIPESAVSTG